MTWTRNRARIAGGKAVRAEVLDAYPYCQCKGCAACGGWAEMGCTEAIMDMHGAKVMDVRAMLGCARPSTEDDHILPVAEGGTEEWENHQGLCTECHRKKSLAEAVRGNKRRAARGRFDEGEHPGLLPRGTTPSPRK